MSTNPYAISRKPVYARNGMVATSQPLAAQAGLFLLKAGGNAMDAAIATAAALTVLEPVSNGIGGDAFALVWSDGTLHGLNGSGRAPGLLTPEALHAATGSREVPARGWLPVTVPGGPRAWVDLHQRFGRLPLEQVFAPAVAYARDGYALSPMVAAYWRRACRVFGTREGAEFDPWRQTFAPAGFVPEAGATWRSEDLARTLEQIAASGAKTFYEGEVATAIDRFARQTGGLIRASDLAAHASEWVEPIRIGYRGYDVWEIPPNTQGIAALAALGILSELDLPGERDSVEGLHKQIEAMKQGFADTYTHVGDPVAMAVSSADLLTPGHIDSLRARITGEAIDITVGSPPHGDTVYLCSADRDGMMVSLIQSNYMGFGSGIVVPGTGVALQNRGRNFSADPGHPNAAAPGKRPYHTIMPGFLTRDGHAVGPFGVMGGFMQPQGHLQVVVNTVDYGMQPQAALDAPRWQWLKGREVAVEHAMPAHLIAGLAARGHQVSIGMDVADFGRGQIIWRDAGGVLVGGSESRTDGQVAAW